MPAVGNDPRNGSWEREFEKNGRFHLPDCRVKYLERDRFKVRMSFGQCWDTVFCASCHKPWAATPPDCPYVFFICDSCIADKGPPPDIMPVPSG